MNYDAQKVTYQEVTIFDRPALWKCQEMCSREIPKI